MSVPIRMVGEKVLVRPYTQETVRESDSGLLVGAQAVRALKRDGISFTDDEPPIAGIVEAVGTFYCEDCEHRRRLPFSRGQLLIFPKQAGQIVDMGGETFYVLKPDQILGEVLPLEATV